jgi:hypothetical protein
MCRDTPSRDMHVENMDLVQFHVGSTATFWDLPYEEYGILAPDGGIKHTWEALSKTPLTLKGPNLGLPNEREKDAALMDAFVAEEYDQKTLIILNECRLYLRVSHLSQISTACGQHVDEQCWSGAQQLSAMRKPLIKTYRPTRKDWGVWQQALQTTFLQLDAEDLRLKNPLGPWLQRKSTTWKW